MRNLFKYLALTAQPVGRNADSGGSGGNGRSEIMRNLAKYLALTAQPLGRNADGK